MAANIPAAPASRNAAAAPPGIAGSREASEACAAILIKRTIDGLPHSNAELASMQTKC